VLTHGPRRRPRHCTSPSAFYHAGRPGWPSGVCRVGAGLGLGVGEGGRKVGELGRGPGIGGLEGDLGEVDMELWGETVA
jgi:hypothetical protein